jgi:hypothetical protein
MPKIGFVITKRCVFRVNPTTQAKHASTIFKVVGVLLVSEGKKFV